jgi:hypothetical protein
MLAFSYLNNHKLTRNTSVEKSPYIISAELDLNTMRSQDYIKQTNLDRFREDLDTDLRNMDKETIWVSSGKMTASINRATKNTSLPIISLDDRYVKNADQYLGISRSIDPNLNDTGYTARLNYPTLSEQLCALSALGPEVTLVDDVLYSGEMISWLNNNLAKLGITIRSVAVGIAIQKGIDKLAAQGIDVWTDNAFNDIEDEICERDLAFVQGSGRRVTSSNNNALYFDSNNGNPEKWASIEPDASMPFCIASIERSLRLLRPNTPTRSIGKFLGYSTVGSISNTLTTRLGELQ